VITLAHESVVTKGAAKQNTTLQAAIDPVVKWILPIVAGLLIILLALRLTDFYYKYAWASAHFATIARSFATHGIIGLRGIPIENFDPVTAEPDNYLHWPPFFFYALSLVLDLFPSSIRAMHLFMAAIALATAFVMWKVASIFFKPRAAIVCTSAFLLMPATLRYGLVLLPVNLAVLEVSATLLFMLRYLQSTDKGRERTRNLGLSAFALYMACVTSWEAFLVPPGLLLAYAFDRRPAVLKTFFCWTFAAMAAGASIFTLYSLSDPTFFRDLWSTFTFRAGLTQYLPLVERVHPVEGTAGTVSGFNALSPYVFAAAYIARTQEFAGSLGILGIFVLLLKAFGPARSPPNKLFALLMLPLCTFWLGWAIIMQQHYVVHEYQMVLATPILAIAIAGLYSLLEKSPNPSQESWLRANLLLLANLVLPFALLLSGVLAAWTTIAGENDPKLMANLGRRIQSEVPAGAVVITNESSMVTTYYAERHVLRGMIDMTYLENHLTSIRGLCPSCPLYFALQRESEYKFSDALLHMQPVFEDDRVLIKILK